MGRNIKQITRRRTQNWQRFTFGFCCYWTSTLKIQTWNGNNNNKKNKKNELRIIENILVQAKNKNRQLFGSLNRYAFAYARRDKVIEVAKGTPDVIKAARSDINNIAEKRTNQFISKEGKEIEHVLSKLQRGATEDVYQTPFRLLGEFGKKKFNSFKTKILK